MRYAVNSEEMKKIDDYTIRTAGIPALELMERAAMEVVRVMKKRIDQPDRILAVCGAGNNGGDGVAAGRLLYLQGYHVAILFIGEENKASDSMKLQLEMAKRIGIPMENRDRLPEYNIIIDALFGVGLSRPVSGEYEEIIKRINQGRHYVYSVDLPSGISADNGQVMKLAVKADETVTFGHNKLGLVLYPGAEYAGKLTVADIGFPQAATDQVEPGVRYYEPVDLERLPGRRRDGHKGSFGKVLIIAGSKGMGGAAYLSGKAAYRTGAGLVKLMTSEANRLILQTLLPEALFSSYDGEGADSEERQHKLLRELEWASAVVVGPGLGLTATAKELVETVINKATVPVIIDADAINLLAGMLDHNQEAGIRDRWRKLASLLKENTILTPHLLELARLMGVSVAEISNNLVDTANQCSYNNKLIYAIKDARTFVVQEMKRYLNVSGNNGMATGGSGDVLTGIIAALMAQGMVEYEAACLGVYIHGLAGDAAAREKGVYSLMASDIIDSLGDVLKKASGALEGTL
ncbi:MAG TPA: NAD(P)H-hydrate dehydratase [Clostridiales bacterium]|nr:NAD(P)H-hydrate dehydratase [Clostridiales bacterium]